VQYFLLLASAYFVYGLMQVGVDQDYVNSANSLYIEFTREAMGLAVNIVFFKSKQAFWYSFIERLYELSQKYC
jgi:hypothetical protein